MEDKTIFILDTNIHLDCITTALLSPPEVNFYSMVGKADCKLGIAPNTEDELLRNLPKAIEDKVNVYKDYLKRANTCLNKVKAHVDKLGEDAESVVGKCISIIQNSNRLDIKYEEAKKFCNDYIFTAPYRVDLVSSEQIEKVIKAAEQRVKFHRPPALNKEYDLGDCIYWESLLMATDSYSKIVFATGDKAFGHKNNLHPYLMEDLPDNFPITFFVNHLEMIKSVRDILPENIDKPPEEKIPSDAIITASADITLTSIPQAFHEPTLYLYKEVTCPRCGLTFTPESYEITQDLRPRVICPQCHIRIYPSE